MACPSSVLEPEGATASPGNCRDVLVPRQESGGVSLAKANLQMGIESAMQRLMGMFGGDPSIALRLKEEVSANVTSAEKLEAVQPAIGGAGLSIFESSTEAITLLEEVACCTLSPTLVEVVPLTGAPAVPKLLSTSATLQTLERALNHAGENAAPLTKAIGCPAKLPALTPMELLAQAARKEDAAKVAVKAAPASGYARASMMNRAPDVSRGQLSPSGFEMVAGAAELTSVGAHAAPVSNGNVTECAAATVAGASTGIIDVPVHTLTSHEETNFATIPSLVEVDMGVVTDKDETLLTLYIGGLPLGTAEGLIKAECNKYGSIVALRRKSEPWDPLVGGWAMVQYTSSDMVASAVQKLRRRSALFGSLGPLEVRPATAGDLQSIPLPKPPEDNVIDKSAQQGTPEKADVIVEAQIGEEKSTGEVGDSCKVASSGKVIEGSRSRSRTAEQGHKNTAISRNGTSGERAVQAPEGIRLQHGWRGPSRRRRDHVEKRCYRSESARRLGGGPSSRAHWDDRKRTCRESEHRGHGSAPSTGGHQDRSYRSSRHDESRGRRGLREETTQGSRRDAKRRETRRNSDSSYVDAREADKSRAQRTHRQYEERCCDRHHDGKQEDSALEAALKDEVSSESSSSSSKPPPKRVGGFDQSNQGAIVLAKTSKVELLGGKQVYLRGDWAKMELESGQVYYLNVKTRESKIDMPAGFVSPAMANDPRTVFCKNKLLVSRMPLVWDEAMLAHHFRAFGQITNVTIQRDPHGLNLGSGFVVYGTELEAQLALNKMHGQFVSGMYGGQCLKVMMTR